MTAVAVLRPGLRAAGVALDPSLIRQGSFTLDSGYGAARELLSVAPDVSFIACATDTMAAGALRAIDEVRGMGEGIHRVSGFGDNAFLRALTGGIPTVHYGYLTSGVEATNMLAQHARWRGGGERSQDTQARPSAYECLGLGHVCLPLSRLVFP